MDVSSEGPSKGLNTLPTLATLVIDTGRKIEFAPDLPGANMLHI